MDRSAQKMISANTLIQNIIPYDAAQNQPDRHLGPRQ